MSDSQDKSSKTKRDTDAQTHEDLGHHQSVDSHSQSSEFEETINYEGSESTQDATTAQSDLPASLGRYKIRRLLGKGAYGAVYLGYDQQLKREVAIKVPHVGVSQKDKDSFLEEAQRLAQLKHPGIVSVFDIGVDEGRCYIVSDYLQGQTLQDWLKTNQPTWQAAVRIVIALADALAHAHARRIVHRDLKPGNVIMTEDLGPVIVDFGLAVSDEQVPSERGRIAGTPFYMSPEQARGEGHRVDGRTDIYALGVMLYEFLTGRVPFQATQLKELIRQVREDEPQPPRQIVRDLPAELERICLKAMAKRFSGRYINADDLVVELRQLIGEVLSQSASIVAPQADSTSVPAETTGSQSSSVDLPSSVRRAREAERRQVTVVACGCDVFQSDEILESLDPEEQNEILIDFQQLCREVVERYEGTVVQTTDDGVLVCFGFPLAFEDAPERAVRTGLDVVQEMAPLNKRLETRTQIQLNSQVAIHTGVAVVEDKSGDGGENLSIVGQVRNVVNQLVGLADSNTVLISERTHRLVKGFFDCESLGAQRIKGVAANIEVFQVKGQRKVGSRVDLAEPQGLTPLIGRDREVGLLEERWEQAAEGMGQVVLLIGDAGLGKSRLVHVLKEHVLSEVGQDSDSPGRSGDDSGSFQTDHMSPVIEWRCTPQHQNSRLYPAIECFQRMLNFTREDTPRDRLDKLVKHLDQLKIDGDEEVGLLASLLSLPLDDRYSPLAMSPQRQKEQTLTLLLDWLRECSYQQPVLFIVEDLHWVDPTTLEFFETLVAEGERDSMLTLLTFRPEFETPWTSKAHQTQVALTRLTKRQIGEMMILQSGVKTIPQDVVDQVIERTDGVPLFVEEFTQMVIDAGTLREVEGDMEMSASFPIHEIPATLQDLLVSRLDRMASNLDVVQMGATIGREFTYELMRAVSTLDEAVLQAELTKLVESELLFQRGRGPRSRYQFKHALIQDAAYLSLLKKKRQQFHGRIADALKQEFTETAESEPEVVAYHYTEAGQALDGIEYWLKAGQKAIESSANLEAIDHLQRGLDLIETLDESPERDRQELELLTAKAVPLSTVKGYVIPEVKQAYNRARELCQRLQDTQVLFTALHGLYRYDVVRGDSSAARDLAKELLERAQDRGDAGDVLEAHRALSLTNSFIGDFTAVKTHTEQALAIYDIQEHRSHAFVYGADPGVLCHSFSVWSLWHRGYPDQAMRTTGEALQLADQLGHPHSRAFSLGCAAATHFVFRRDWELADQRVDESFELAKEQSFPFWLGWSLCLKGATLAHLGKPADGIAKIKQGLAAFQQAGVGLGRPFLFALLADACRLDERVEEGMAALDEAFQIVGDTGCLYQPELHRLQGVFQLTGSAADHEKAAANFRTAMEIAERSGARMLQLRAAVNLARLLMQLGRTEEAKVMFAPLVNSFDEGHDSQDLKDASLLLAELG